MRKQDFKISNIQYPILFTLFFVLCSLFFAYLQWSPSFADPDSFYHAKAAALMSQEGIIKSFPWLPFTSFSQNFTDQHFFYHLLLLPFILIFPPLLGTKILAILLATLAICFFYFFLKHWKIRWPWFYILILLSIPAFVFRLNLAKAGPLSLIILLIGLSWIWQKKYWALGILSFLYVWLHGGWILLLLLSVCSIIANIIIYDRKGTKNKEQRTKEKKNRFKLFLVPCSLFFKKILSGSNGRLLLAIVSGLAAGLVVNPYFLHNFRFYWEQVVQIGFWNYQGVIPVGMEWYPYKIGDFVAGNAFSLILAIGAWAAFFWKIQKEGGGDEFRNEQIFVQRAAPDLPREEMEKHFQKIFTLYIFALILGLMTLKSQRFIEYFVPFFILANAFLLNFSLPKNFSPWPAVKIFFNRNLINKIVIIYLAGVWLIFFVGKNWDLRQQLTKAFSWSYLQGASQWLSQNTPNRSLIFHSGWSDFPMLFYHNNHNVYLAGMDPTFFYRYNRELYKKWTRIIQAQEPRMAEMIKNDFGANFILIKLKEKSLLEMVEKDPRFVLRYEDGEARVFEVK